MAEKRDYYEVLGLQKGAGEDEIKKGYRQMTKKYHPDLNPGNKEAEEKMKEVNEAYDVLSDPQKKARYDQFGHAGVDPNMGGGGGGGFGGFWGFPGGFPGGGAEFDLSDLLGGMFGGGFGGGRTANPNAPRQGADQEERVVVAFEEAAKGCKRTLEINRVEPCDECGGNGAARGTQPKTCAECGGTGQKTVQQRTPFGVISSSKPCPVCGGRGKTIGTPCAKCRGGGRVRRRVPVTVSFPAGIDNGQTLRVTGEGNKGQNGGPPGDLLVGVTVRPHAIFERDGFNMWCDVTVQFWQAALGDVVTVPTLEGGTELRVPPGTQPGTIFTLRGFGIPVLNNGGRKGDLYVRLQVAVPAPAQFTVEQRTLFEQLRARFPATAAAERPKAPPTPPEEKHGFFGKKRK
ncbi:MAG: molecular chaperone DnaJ [Oscillospiraceae bacterium]|jgi:molecular chaperone DnaJ|nr:molecular chaperone DnaJ [Oscillospiraceae bacterium]